MHTVGDVPNKVYAVWVCYIITESACIFRIYVHHINSQESKGMLLRRQCSQRDFKHLGLLYSKVHPRNIPRISISSVAYFNNIKALLHAKLPIQCPKLAEMCQRHVWVFYSTIPIVSCKSICTRSRATETSLFGTEHYL